MKYDEMSRIYPWIEELFALVAGQIHAGMPASGIMPFLEIRIQSEIHKQHRQAVTDKLTQFARVVEENSNLKGMSQQ